MGTLRPRILEIVSGKLAGKPFLQAAAQSVRVGGLRVPSTKVIDSDVPCAEGSWRAAVGIAMWPSATLMPTPSFALAGSNRVALR